MRLTNKLKNVINIIGRTAETLCSENKECVHSATRETLGIQNCAEKRNPVWWTSNVEQKVKDKKRLRSIVIVIMKKI